MWISIKDRLPKFKQGAKYLVSDGNDISITWCLFAFTGPTSIDWLPLKGFKCIDKVTHWMKLPQPPKDK